MRYHQDKMRSKDERPAAQMVKLGGGVPVGKVIHIIDDNSEWVRVF